MTEDTRLRVKQLEQQLGRLERENTRLNVLIGNLNLKLAMADSILRDIAINGRDESAHLARGWVLTAKKAAE